MGAAAFASAGCSTQPPEQRVGQRAVERWQALIHGDLPTAYGYLSPGFRAVNSLESYQRGLGRAVRWKDIKLGSVACQSDACEVTLTLAYEYSSAMIKNYQGEKLLKEKWVRADHEWWYLPTV